MAIPLWSAWLPPAPSEAMARTTDVQGSAPPSFTPRQQQQQQQHYYNHLPYPDFTDNIYGGHPYGAAAYAQQAWMLQEMALPQMHDSYSLQQQQHSETLPQAAIQPLATSQSPAMATDPQLTENVHAGHSFFRQDMLTTGAASVPSRDLGRHQSAHIDASTHHPASHQTMSSRGLLPADLRAQKAVGIANKAAAITIDSSQPYSVARTHDSHAPYPLEPRSLSFDSSLQRHESRTSTQQTFSDLYRRDPSLSSARGIPSSIDRTSSLKYEYHPQSDTYVPQRRNTLGRVLQPPLHHTPRAERPAASSPVKSLKCAAMRLHLHKLFREPGPKRVGRDVVVRQDRDAQLQASLPVSSTSYDEHFLRPDNYARPQQWHPHPGDWAPNQHYFGEQDASLSGPQADYRSSLDLSREIWNVPFSSAIPEDRVNHALRQDTHTGLQRHDGSVPFVEDTPADDSEQNPGRLNWARRVLQPLQRRVAGNQQANRHERTWSEYFPEIIEANQAHFVDDLSLSKDFAHQQDATHAPRYIRRKAAPRESMLSANQEGPQQHARYEPPRTGIHELRDDYNPCQRLMASSNGLHTLQENQISSTTSLQMPSALQMNSLAVNEKAQLSQVDEARISNERFRNSQAYTAMLSTDLWQPAATSNTGKSLREEQAASTGELQSLPQSQKERTSSGAHRDDMSAAIKGSAEVQSTDISRAKRPELARHPTQDETSQECTTDERRSAHTRRPVAKMSPSSMHSSREKRFAIYGDRAPELNVAHQKDFALSPKMDDDEASLSQHRSETTQEWHHIRNRAAEKYRDWVHRTALHVINATEEDEELLRRDSRSENRRRNIDRREKRSVHRHNSSKRNQGNHRSQSTLKELKGPPVPPKSPRLTVKGKEKRSREGVHETAVGNSKRQDSASSDPVDPRELEARLCKLAESIETAHREVPSSSIGCDKGQLKANSPSNVQVGRGFAHKMLSSSKAEETEQDKDIDSGLGMASGQNKKRTEAHESQRTSSAFGIQKHDAGIDATLPIQCDKACSVIGQMALMSLIPSIPAPDEETQDSTPALLQAIAPPRSRDQAVASMQNEVLPLSRPLSDGLLSSQRVPVFSSDSSAAKEEADDESIDEASSDVSLYLEAKLELKQRILYWQQQVKNTSRRVVYAASAATSAPSSALRGPIRGEHAQKRMSHLTSISRRDVLPPMMDGKIMEEMLKDFEPNEQDGNIVSRRGSRATPYVHCQLQQADFDTNTQKQKAEMMFRGSPSQFIDLIIDSIKLAESLVGPREQNEQSNETSPSKDMAQAKRESSTLPKTHPKSTTSPSQWTSPLVDLSDSSPTCGEGTRHMQQLSDELSMRIFGGLELPSTSTIISLSEKEAALQAHVSAPAQQKPSGSHLLDAGDEQVEECRDDVSQRGLANIGHCLRRVPNIAHLRKVSAESEEPALYCQQSLPLQCKRPDTLSETEEEVEPPASNKEKNPSKVDTPLSSSQFVNQFTKKLDAYIESASDVTHLHQALVQLHQDLLEKMSRASDVAVLEHRLSSLEKAFFSSTASRQYPCTARVDQV